MTESFNTNRIRAMTHATWHSNPPSKRQSETKYEFAIYMCKETAENGGLLKEYCVSLRACIPGKLW